MRLVLFILITFIAFINKGFAEEKPSKEFVIRIAPDQLELRENGIFFSTDIFGDVKLNNLQFDEEGCFTTFQVAFACTDCQKQFDIHPLICDRCASINLEIVALDRTDDNSLYALQSMFLGILNNFSIYNEKILCSKGSLSVGGGTETNGKKTVDVQIQGESDDGSFSWEGTGSVETDSEGHTNGKAEARVRWNFNT